MAATLRFVNIQIIIRQFDIVLPVGISFYTFQALSYTFDVYRGKVKVERNFLRYALFVSFFPQLVAGPIERSTNLLSQIETINFLKLWDYRRIIDGCKIMVYGYFLKMVVADRAAVYVNLVFGNYRAYNTSVLCLACIFFAVQIYCDFNSYSLIAIGSAKVLGFSLMENFDAPYFSRSVSEFWRRWHISLNTWFRDYLYIPLGGSRCSKWRQAINVMIVFLASGLWHGANWTFVIWGGLNGLYQVTGSFLRPIKEKAHLMLKTKTNSFSYKTLQTILTFVLVDIAWVFFRAESVGDAVEILGRIVSRWDPWVFTGSNVLQNLLPSGMKLIELEIALSCILIVFVVDVLRYRTQKNLHVLLEKECIWFRWGVYLVFLLMILVYGVYGADFQSIDFIYFQF